MGVSCASLKCKHPFGRIMVSIQVEQGKPSTEKKEKPTKKAKKSTSNTKASIKKEDLKEIFKNVFLILLMVCFVGGLIYQIVVVTPRKNQLKELEENERLLDREILRSIYATQKLTLF